MLKTLTKFLFLLIGINVGAEAQKISFDPVDWTPNQPLTIKFDFTATQFHNFSGNLYGWLWTKNPASQTIDSPNNGTWGASSTASQLTNLGNNQWSITITPSNYLGIDAELLKISGFYFLVKNQDGTRKTEDYGSITPWADSGIKPSTCWWSKRKVTLTVDVKNTPLEGSTNPLYYWGWYNTGSGDVSASQNGTWSASSTNSQMTQVSTNIWKIDLDLPSFFGTTANNLTATSVFGLIKNYNGSLKTNDFGVGKSYKAYQITQLPLSKVTVTPSYPTDNEPVTIRFTGVDDLAGFTDKVYLHVGATTSASFSENWDKVPTNWEDTTSTIGQMTNIGVNQWEITLPSIRSFFNLSATEKAYKIGMRIRTKLGGYSEGDGCQNANFLVNNGNFLEVREPVGSVLTKPLNQPFRITAYSPLSSDFTIQVNGTSIASQVSSNRISTTFTPTAEGLYSVQITTTNAGNTLTKTLQVRVCGTTSIQQTVSLPAGMKYGINYHPADATKATLVLHAPTENIQSVHLIGDFNNWLPNCTFLMNYDATKKVFWKEVSDLIPQKEYVFQYLIDGKTRIADPYANKISDPWNDNWISNATYPNLIQYPTAAKSSYGETFTIASVLQTSQPTYNWQVTNFRRPPHNQLNIYQLNFRDFTPEGTYIAATQKLDYLKRMGVNAIETLPVSEFEGNNSWGYNPNFYFAVDKAYGTANDYKLFVDECHKKGIAVLGDIVLNHAFGTNAMARMYWNEINSRPESNNPWFNQKTNFDNPGANWGNDFNHESTHTKAFVDSVIHYWLTEFKIDGIRFDFTKGFSNTPYPNASCADPWGGCYDATRIAILKRMANKAWSINNGAIGAAPIVIFEHLATQAEDKELADFGVLLWSGVSPNYKYSEIAMGYAPTTSDPNKSDISLAYYKNKGFLNANWISYMESHDEERLAYKAKTYGNGTVQADLPIRTKFLQAAAVMNLLLPSARMVWQFGELGYDFSIDYNQRTGKKPIRWDYWADSSRRKIYETYSRLFWLRNHLPNTFHRELDNPSGNKTDFVSQFKRYHFYNSVGDTAVTIIANTANSVVSGNPQFNAITTDWYEFFSQQTHNFPVPPSANVTLQPGEFRIYFNKPITQNLPQISLTSAISSTIGHDTTDVLLKFDKPIEKAVVGSFLGEKLTVTNLQNVISVINQNGVPINFSGSVSIDNQQIRVFFADPLPFGNYTLTILPNTLQNYAGIKISVPITFNFTIQQTPCEAIKQYQNLIDDVSAGTLMKQVSDNIQANNKVTNTAKVVFDAKEYVLLKEGMLISPINGGSFTAKIGGCD